MNHIFHLAFKVKDIESTIIFYRDVLGCTLGRQTKQWVDFNFFGNQLSAHVSEALVAPDYCGEVDGIKVPIPHFGCILNAEEFERLKKNMEKFKVEFIVKPQVRYPEQIGEQLTMFVLDYSNNPLEFKCFSNTEEIFN